MRTSDNHMALIKFKFGVPAPYVDWDGPNPERNAGFGPNEHGGELVLRGMNDPAEYPCQSVIVNDKRGVAICLRDEDDVFLWTGWQPSYSTALRKLWAGEVTDS